MSFSFQHLSISPRLANSSPSPVTLSGQAPTLPPGGLPAKTSLLASHQPILLASSALPSPPPNVGSPKHRPDGPGDGRMQGRLLRHQTGFQQRGPHFLTHFLLPVSANTPSSFSPTCSLLMHCALPGLCSHCLECSSFTTQPQEPLPPGSLPGPRPPCRAWLGVAPCGPTEPGLSPLPCCDKWPLCASLCTADAELQAPQEQTPHAVPGFLSRPGPGTHVVQVREHVVLMLASPDVSQC